MEKIKVFVVTDTEAGWDCVRGVYLNREQIAGHWGIPVEDVPEDGHESFHPNGKQLMLFEETLTLEENV